MGGETNNGSILGNATKLIIPAFVAIILGLIGVVWTLINGQMNELRTDIRVLQTKNDEQSGSLRELTQRVADLIATLNERKK